MKLEINTWRLNKTVRNKQCVQQEIKSERKTILKTNEDDSKMYQNVWFAAKAVFRGKVRAISAYTKKLGSQITDLVIHLKDLKTQQPKAKTVRGKK